MEFTLLSSRLRAVAEEAATTDRNVFRLWVSRNNGDAANGSLFDEIEIMEVVRGMLEDTGVFAFEPESVCDLRATYESSLKGGDDYVKFAFAAQRARVSLVLDSFGKEPIEKQLRNLERAHGRFERELDMLLKINGEGGMVEEVKGRALMATKRRVKKGDTEEVLLARYFEHRTEILNREIDRRRRKIKEAVDSLYEVGIKIAVLKFRVEIKQKAQRVMSATKVKLAEMGVALEEVATESVTVKGTRTGLLSESIDSESPRLPEDAGGGSKKRKKLGNGSAETKEDEGAPAETGDAQYDPIAISLRGIEEAIAAVPNGKIRILLPHDTPRIMKEFAGQWTELLRAMGFTGEVEGADYERLLTTSDLATPVIIPRKMHTHMGRLGIAKNRLGHVVVTDVSSPRQLLQHVQGPYRG